MRVEVVDTAADIPAGAWRELAPDDDPLWSPAMFRVLEDGRLGGPSRFQYLLAVAEGRVVGLLPTCTFRPLRMEEALGSRARDGLRPLLGAWPGALHVPALVCGSPVGTGRLLVDPDAPAAVCATLVHEARRLAVRERLSVVVFKDLDEPALARLRPALQDHGFFEVEALPDNELRLAAGNLSAHLAGLPPRWRRNARAKLRRAEAQADVRLEVVEADFSSLAPRLQVLYDAVLARADVRLERWTPDLFAAIGRSGELDRRLLTCWRGEALLGFLLCLFQGSGGVALRVGFERDHGGDLPLWHLLHYQAIDLACRADVRVLRFCQTTYAAKRELGCELQPLTSAVTLLNPLARALARRVLPPLAARERRAVLAPPPG